MTMGIGQSQKNLNSLTFAAPFLDFFTRLHKNFFTKINP